MRDVLAGTGAYADPAGLDLSIFSPLNLLTVVDDRLIFSTNRPSPEQRDLPPGLYGLSNGTLDEPWPKTVRLKAVVADWLGGKDGQPNRLLDGLAEDAVFAHGDPGSAIFVRNPVYGTRCSSVVAVDHEGRGVFIERRFDAAGLTTGETRLSFNWPIAV